ncbi:MAG: MFS transporter, partial [Paracoccaceae bacterium]|nr:MFS transporter [Paracoccaceae bacterium]
MTFQAARRPVAQIAAQLQRRPPMPLPFVAATPERWLYLRLVIGVGITQIIGFGTIFYAFGSVVPALSDDLGIAPGTAFAAFSAALLIGALAAPTAGRLLDRHGARIVMGTGSVLAALSLIALSQAQGLVSLVLALVAVEVTATLV